MAQQQQLTPPKEFFNLQSFYSLSGCSTAVWVLCAVIANIDMDTGYINAVAYKFIALLFSEVLAIATIYYTIKENKTGHHFLLAFVNGLLIFVTATGINTITNSNALASAPKKTTGLNAYYSNKNYAGFFDFFRNQVDWWGDSRTEAKARELKQQNEELLIKNAALLAKLNAVVTKTDTIVRPNVTPSVDKPGRTTVNPNPAIQKKLNDCNAALEKIEMALNSSKNTVTKLEGAIEQKNKEIDGYLGQISRLKTELERYKLAFSANDDLNINKLQQKVKALEHRLAECKAGKDEQ